MNIPAVNNLNMTSNDIIWHKVSPEVWSGDPSGGDF